MMRHRDDALSAALRELMPDRAIRDFPALLSTEAEARRWASRDAPEGALVVAGYQASPRGRGGLPWQIPEEGVGFSVIVKPGYMEHQEGRLYMAGAMALSDLSADPRIDWPDQVWDGDVSLGATAVHAEIDLLQIAWAVISVLLNDRGREPGKRIATVLERIDARMGQDPKGLAAEYEERLATTGSEVLAHLIPMGPTGQRVEGIALEADIDGSLRIETRDERVVAVRPQHVGLLETRS